MKRALSILGAIAVSITVAMAEPQAVVVSYGCPVINIIDIESKELLWQYEMDEADKNCNSVELLSDGEHIAFTTVTSAQVVSIKTKEVVWEYRPEGGKTVAEVHSIVPLEKGGFAVFVATDPVLVLEVSAEFKITREILFTELTGAESPHKMFRVVTMTKDGNYLLPWIPMGEIYKMSREGVILDRYPISDVFAPFELRNGNLIFGRGDLATIVEYDPKTKSIVRETTSLSEGDNIAWMQFTRQIELIGRDRYLVTNWGGHSKQKIHQANKRDFMPTLMIINGEGEILWHYTLEETSGPMKFKSGISSFHYSKKAIIK